MSAVEHMTVTADEDGMRLDRWFKSRFGGVPISLLNKLLRKGNIRIDGKRAKADSRLQAGQSIRIPPMDKPDPDEKRVFRLSDADKELIASIILFEDADMIVVNKPAGLAVQGGTKSNHRNLDAMMVAYTTFEAGDDDDGGAQARLVHRLDKETSGIQVFAKTRIAAQKLADQFKGKSIEKTYLAVTRGIPMPHEGTIKKPLLRLKDKVVIDEHEGKRAQTDYRVLDKAGQKLALVEAKPLTGRTHQIRVHLAAALNTPILGDDKYNMNFHDEGEKNLKADFSGLFLHARQIVLRHPKTGKTMVFEAPLPLHFKKLFRLFGFEDEGSLG